jgi:hypothetical protein
MTWVQAVSSGMGWFWAYVLGYIFAFTMVISAGWVFFAGIRAIITW